MSRLKNFLVLSSFYIFLWGNNQYPDDSQKPFIDNQGLQLIKFMPESAVEYPFDSIFCTLDILKLEIPSKYQDYLIFNLRKNDSVFLVCQPSIYNIFRLNGQFRNSIGDLSYYNSKFKTNFFFYFDNNYITAISYQDWIRIDLNGRFITGGQLEYPVYPRDFLPLNDSLWLIYTEHSQGIRQSETMRLWTADKHFKLKTEFLKFPPNLRFSTGFLFRNLHPAPEGIYVTDRFTDTIYLFKDSVVKPVYLLQYGPYIPDRFVRMENLRPDEVYLDFILINGNTIFYKVKTLNKSYFVYYNKLTGRTININSLKGGMNLLKYFQVIGSDDHGNIYWLPGKTGLSKLMGDPEVSQGIKEIIWNDINNVPDSGKIIITTRLRK